MGDIVCSYTVGRTLTITQIRWEQYLNVCLTAMPQDGRSARLPWRLMFVDVKVSCGVLSDFRPAATAATNPIIPCGLTSDGGVGQARLRLRLGSDAACSGSTCIANYHVRSSDRLKPSGTFACFVRAQSDPAASWPSTDPLPHLPSEIPLTQRHPVTSQCCANTRWCVKWTRVGARRTLDKRQSWRGGDTLSSSSETSNWFWFIAHIGLLAIIIGPAWV